MLISFTAFFISYLIGSLSSAIIVCRLLGLPDPRTQGSQNPGATNVLRIAGKGAAAVTLLGDMLKGMIPVLAAKWLGLDLIALSLCAFAAFIGHLFPIFFHFKGGKGVATLLGALIALCWPAALCWMATWFVIALIFRYSSLSSLIASLLAPLYLWYFTDNMIVVATFAVMSALLVYRHQNNIVKLFAGTESKIGKKI
jgi:acyl phosphate:glycerol-3-phosphate acyltransferase